MGLPIVIYNVVPWNTVAPETLLRLSEIPQVIAVKQSGGGIHKLPKLLRLNNGRLQALSALDDLLYPSFVLGAQGAIAAILTIVPDLAVAFWEAVQRGDHGAARRPLLPLSDEVRREILEALQQADVLDARVPDIARVA